MYLFHQHQVLDSVLHEISLQTKDNICTENKKNQSHHLMLAASCMRAPNDGLNAAVHAYHMQLHFHEFTLHVAVERGSEWIETVKC